MGRAPIVVGILAIAVVVAWLLLRGDDTPKAKPTSPTGSADLTRADPRAKVSAPEGPSLPSGSAAKPELSAAPTADDVFSEETRDDTWAAKTEADIAERWKKIRGGKLESTECRASQCRLVVTGAEPDVAQAIADLEGPRGMHGFANNVHLTSPEKRADGSIALRVFVRFDRPEN